MAIKCKRCVHRSDRGSVSVCNYQQNAGHCKIVTAGQPVQEGAWSIIFVTSRKWSARWGSGRGRGVGGIERVRGL